MFKIKGRTIELDSHSLFVFGGNTKLRVFIVWLIHTK